MAPVEIIDLTLLQPLAVQVWWLQKLPPCIFDCEHCERLHVPQAEKLKRSVADIAKRKINLQIFFKKNPSFPTRILTTPTE
jgi:hypothetical protein